MFVYLEHFLVEALRNYIQALWLAIFAHKRVCALGCHVVLTHHVEQVIAEFVAHEGLVDVAGIQDPAFVFGKMAE